jgi:energy-converting hydrogenase Eha subunit B
MDGIGYLHLIIYCSNSSNSGSIVNSIMKYRAGRLEGRISLGKLRSIKHKCLNLLPIYIYIYV